MRLNGHGTLTMEDARTWVEETGLCLFLPRRQFSSSIAPSFVEAVAGERNSTPDPRHIALAEELLVRLETDNVAVRLNLLGQPGEQPDYVVASWVLPYVYALRGDRDWRRSPQLTGSRQVSQLAVQAYKLLEAGDATISVLTHALGREVTEAAVLRAITELWQQLRIIPVVSAPGQSAQWQLLRTRYQKAIAEGASTSQVHTISMGHAPLFYVAGTLPEFAVAPTVYASSSMPASAYFLHSWDREDEATEVEAPKPSSQALPAIMDSDKAASSGEARAPRSSAARKPSSGGKSAAARPHFSPGRRTTHSRDRKPAQSSTGGRPARRMSSEARPSATRSAGTHSGNGSGNGTRSSGSTARAGKAPAPAWSERNGRSNAAKSNGKLSSDARPMRGSRKPALTAGAKAGNSNRFGFTARPKAQSKTQSKSETKKRA